MTSYLLYVNEIEEQVVEGKRLGRHVRHDSRNRQYAYRAPAGVTLTSQLWTRNAPILDQGNLGSCTGNEMVGALACDPLFGALPAGHAVLDETLAVAIYSAGEKIDGGQGYPPEDQGSTGPSVAQAARDMGLISGWQHCFSLNDVLAALEDHALGIGANWYDSMDRPDSTGLVTVSPGAQVRGGHEFLCRGKDVASRLLFFDNSWGTGWGHDGSFSMSYDTLDRLLGEQGDATVSLPLSAPAPVPTPVPPGPSPVPVPDADPDDAALAQGVTRWASEHHFGEAARAAKAQRTWLHKRGFL